MSQGTAPSSSILDPLLAGFVASFGSGDSTHAMASSAIARSVSSDVARMRDLVARLDARWREVLDGQDELAQRRQALALLSGWSPTPQVERMARASLGLAKVPSLGLHAHHPLAAADAELQLGIEHGGTRSGAALLSDERFCDPLRFPLLPPVVDATPSLEHERESGSADRYDAELLLQIERDAPDELVGAMERQWGFLHQRGLPGQVNINSLTRALYNRHGVERIAASLDRVGIDRPRILCLTGYETPLATLLERDGGAEVTVADLATSAHETVARKYPAAVGDGRLRLLQRDLSGISTAWQVDEARALARVGGSSATIARHLATLARGDVFAPVPYEDGAFHAVHAPFVCGSLHLGALTAAANQAEGGHVELTERFGSSLESMPEMLDAMLTTTSHVFRELERVLAPGGTLVVNLWARPVRTDRGVRVKFSDTHLEPEQAEGLVDGWSHAFSGNPQPGLPLTVGRIFTYEKPRAATAGGRSG
ncbi:MAG: hypothetical protein AAGK22_27305 [Acidobacteriota bacterium]